MLPTASARGFDRGLRAIAGAAVLALAGCDALPLYDPFGAREPLVPPVGCTSDAACPKGYCDLASGACLGCRTDADCVFGPAGACWLSVGTCDTTKATCTYAPRGAGALCDDANACTLDDACDGSGACVGGAARTCDDHDPCTKDACDGATGCLATTVEDGTSCGGNGEVCRAGRCECGRAQAETSCSDGVDNDCNGKVDCADPACDGEGCNDGDVCTGNEVCAEGQCQDGTRVTCDAPRPTGCFERLGICSSDTGACHYRPVDEDTACDDHDACTTNDVCDDAGGCAGATPVECRSPPGACWKDVGSCDPAKGCLYEPKDAGEPCSDVDACTTGETCDGRGACVPASRNTCDPAPGPCARLARACDPATGLCTWTAAEAGTVCRAADPAKRCDLPERCDGTSFECPATDAVSGTGLCCTAPVNTPCDDGDKCTTGEKCNAQGACVPSQRTTCEPPGACAVLSAECDPQTGACSWKPAEKGTECRPASFFNPCDAPELCDGASLHCPNEDAVRPDGMCCGAFAACSKGICQGTGRPCLDEF